MSDVPTKPGNYDFQLTELRAENDLLRRSAQTFGELAERLNGALAAAVKARSKFLVSHAHSVLHDRRAVRGHRNDEL